MACEVYSLSLWIAFWDFSFSLRIASSAADIFSLVSSFTTVASAIASSTSSISFKIVILDLSFSARRESDNCLTSFLSNEIFLSLCCRWCTESSNFLTRASFLLRSSNSISLYSFLRGLLRAAPAVWSLGVVDVVLDAITWGFTFAGRDRAARAPA